MARGIDGRELFVSDDDRRFFLNILSQVFLSADYRCYAWTLMSNHYHLLLRTSDIPPGEVMRKINSAYARYYSRTYSRHGYLFQDRFKSIATQDQKYVEEIVRYIHLNPVRAGICTDVNELDTYEWSGHAAIMGSNGNGFQDVKTVLKRFGKEDMNARFLYRKFIEDGLASADNDIVGQIRENNKGRENIFHTGCWVIGDQQFVRGVMAADKENRLRIARYKREGCDINAVACRIAAKTGIAIDKIRSRGRLTVAAHVRQAFAYICRREMGFPVVEIGRYLGITGPAASICIKKGADAVKKMKLENVFRKTR
jgi:REP element-mobilizing transposase RayT